MRITRVAVPIIGFTARKVSTPFSVRPGEMWNMTPKPRLTMDSRAKKVMSVRGFSRRLR